MADIQRISLNRKTKSTAKIFFSYLGLYIELGHQQDHIMHQCLAVVVATHEVPPLVIVRINLA